MYYSLYFFTRFLLFFHAFSVAFFTHFLLFFSCIFCCFFHTFFINKTCEISVGLPMKIPRICTIQYPLFHALFIVFSSIFICFCHAFFVVFSYIFRCFLHAFSIAFFHCFLNTFFIKIFMHFSSSYYQPIHMLRHRRPRRALPIRTRRRALATLPNGSLARRRLLGKRDVAVDPIAHLARTHAAK